ncbi:MAG: hypothetical protein H7267_10825, partial [Sandarakinorhabdus sp.]|nr:hypothetical protein [Sandarakinorhabdus sp.]
MSRRPRWPWWVAGAAAVLWLLIAAAELVALAIKNGVPAAVLNTAIIVLVLAAPVAIIALVALQLRDTGPARAERSDQLADAAWLTDHRLDEAGQLLADFEARFAVLADQARGISAGSRALDKAADAANAAGTRLEAIVPAATAQAEALRALLAVADGDLQRQLGETETLLAALWIRAGDITAQTSDAATTATRQIEAITAAAGAATAALTVPLTALGHASSTALDTNAATAAAIRKTVEANAAVLADSVAAASGALEKIGDAATRRAAVHLSTLQAAATQLTAEIANQADRYRIFIEQLDRGFTTLDARLVTSVAASKVGLDTVATGMAAARDAVVGLAGPIGSTHAALEAVEAKVTGIGAAAETTMAALDTALPAAAPKITYMTAALGALNASAAALAAPIAGGVAAIDDAGAALLATQNGLDAAAARVHEQLAAARHTIAEIETIAGSTALAAASQLVDVFGRVRDVATQSAGTMRASLAAVVSEAETALEAAGSSRAETAFSAPVRAALADIDAANGRAANAAQAAAERITQRLLALIGTIATVEARLTEAEDTYGSRLRADIASRSANLLAAMGAAAIDIGAVLSADIDESAWGKWLGGERGLFVRRAVRLMDGGTARAVADHWRSNSGFRELATRYIGEFEALIARV